MENDLPPELPKMNEISEETQTSFQEMPEIWDNSKRARDVKVVFWVYIGISVVSICATIFEYILLKRINDGVIVDEKLATASDTIQLIVGLVNTGVLIVTIVLFINWFRRAYGNLHRMEVRDLQQEEHMALWVWFIPIISLFKPVMIMNEIWKETQLKLKSLKSSYVFQSGTLIIGFWWALFVFSNFIGNYVTRTVWNAETVDELMHSSQVYIMSDLIRIPEALLVILIVHRLSKIELELAESYEDAGGTIVYK